MSYQLQKPYTEKQRMDFIAEYGQNCNGNLNHIMIIEETETALYALEPWEKLEGDEVIDNTKEYKAEQAKKRQAQFETDFFNTSLGYIRRKVTMANGDTKDFLTDLLPSIAMGIQLQQPVSIIAYKEPDFTEEITDLVKYQEVKQATAEFVQECFMQLNNDFMPPKVEEDLNSGETSNEDIENETNIDTEDEKPIEGDNALVDPKESEGQDEETI